MIKITKPSVAPVKLTVDGAAKCTAHCNDYLLHKAEYDAGKRTFNFDASIYGDRTVKDALIAAQHGKCCFCERKTGLDGDVEHYRPKGGCRQKSSGPLLRPGYYWLAYDLGNLFLACSPCNSRHKRNLFPLEDPTQRALSHTDDISLEVPMLLNPTLQDPEQYISFRKEIPYAINGNRIGKLTIKALGLDRELLNEVRRDRLEILIELHNVISLETELSATTKGRKAVDEAKRLLAHALTDAGEFAAMARAAAKVDFALSLP